MKSSSRAHVGPTQNPKRSSPGAHAERPHGAQSGAQRRIRSGAEMELNAEFPCASQCGARRGAH
eukprot:4435297-Alexandrium_andersonii.AAC.1